MECTRYDAGKQRTQRLTADSNQNSANENTTHGIEYLRAVSACVLSGKCRQAPFVLPDGDEFYCAISSATKPSRAPVGSSRANDSPDVGRGATLRETSRNQAIVNIDPDGTTCTRSDSSESYVCQVDKNVAKYTGEQIKTVNKDYSNAVNTLNSHPNKTVTVTMQGISFKTKAGDVARGLIGATAVTSAKSSASRASTYAGGIGGTSDYHLTYRPTIKIFMNAVTSDRRGEKTNIDSDLSRTFVHEGIHTQPRERAFFHIYKANPAKYEIDHQRECNRAGDALYRGGK